MKWWQWLGPWPLRPVPVGLLIALFALATTSFSLSAQTAPRLIVTGLAIGALAGALMWAAQRIAPGAVTRRPGFFLVVALTALAANAVRFFTGTNIDFPNLTGVTNFVSTWARSVVFIIVILAILGAAQRRLQAQVNRADEAVAALKLQAVALLANDEEVRRQVALVLHDRVQAGLIAACLRLRRTMDAVRPDPHEIEQVIGQLEQLRTLDVRRGVYALSPNLREVDLVTALEELADTYRPAMDVTVTQTTDVPDDMRLGVYRIVEQCLLNAAMHGSAHRCQVDIRAAGGGFVISVTDDGSGLPRDVAPGFGSTLIDTWCRVLDATWARVPAQAGTAVSVAIPRPASQV